MPWRKSLMTMKPTEKGTASKHLKTIQNSKASGSWLHLFDPWQYLAGLHLPVISDGHWQTCCLGVTRLHVPICVNMKNRASCMQLELKYNMNVRYGRKSVHSKSLVNHTFKWKIENLKASRHAARWAWSSCCPFLPRDRRVFTSNWWFDSRSFSKSCCVRFSMNSSAYHHLNHQAHRVPLNDFVYICCSEVIRMYAFCQLGNREPFGRGGSWNFHFGMRDLLPFSLLQLQSSIKRWKVCAKHKHPNYVRSLFGIGITQAVFFTSCRCGRSTCKSPCFLAKVLTVATFSSDVRSCFKRKQHMPGLLRSPGSRKGNPDGMGGHSVLIESWWRLKEHHEPSKPDKVIRQGIMYGSCIILCEFVCANLSTAKQLKET